MFPVPPQVQPQQRAQAVPVVALRPIFCKAVPQLSARPQALLIGRSPRVRRSASALRPALAAQAWWTLAVPALADRISPKNRPVRTENRQQSQQNRQQRRDEVRTQYQQNNPGNFWQENPGWAAYAITRPFAYASWGSVGGWCGYSSEPAAYSYG